MDHSEWAPVHAWHRAVNERDVDAALRAVTDTVEVGGPKGAASGAAVFADWVRRAGIRLEPVSWHPVTSDVIVVEQHATWPDRGDAGPAASQPLRVATLFQLDRGRIARAIRFDSLGAALEAATLAKK